LVIGGSVVVVDPGQVKKDLQEQVIPVLSQKFSFGEEIRVFTER